jgi:hypothetical protein
MHTRFLGTGIFHIVLLLVLTIMIGLNAGCSYNRQRQRKAKPVPRFVKKVAVVGFRSARDQGSSPDVIRSAISGGAFNAEPVPGSKVDWLTQQLFDRLIRIDRYNLVSPSQSRGVYSTLVNSQSTLSELEILKRIGNAFSADGVLAGYLYRWREREGTDYAVRTPASVAYDLYLIRPSDGAVIWKGVFDVTQKSLSENLLEMDTFIEGGGKWMTADRLAGVGLNRLIKELSKPSVSRGSQP